MNICRKCGTKLPNNVVNSNIRNRDGQFLTVCGCPNCSKQYIYTNYPSDDVISEYKERIVMDELINSVTVAIKNNFLYFIDDVAGKKYTDICMKAIESECPEHAGNTGGNMFDPNYILEYELPNEIHLDNRYIHILYSIINDNLESWLREREYCLGYLFSETGDSLNFKVMFYSIEPQGFDQSVNVHTKAKIHFNDACDKIIFEFYLA